MDVQEVGCGMD